MVSHTLDMYISQVKPFICTMPMRLDDGWNQIQFNLADFTRRAYGPNYVETLRVQESINIPPEIGITVTLNNIRKLSCEF